MARKTFNEKLQDSKDMPKIVEINDEKSIKRYGGSKMLIAPPLEYNEIMAKIDTVQQIMDLTDGAGVDKVIVAGGGASTVGEALEVLKVGGVLGNVNHYDGVAEVPLPALAWGAGLADKTIRGGVCPGGRARMEQLVKLVEYSRFDSSKLITHRFTNFEDIYEAMIIMGDKPRDLIKPAVILE